MIKIAACSPVDKVAALVTSKGEQYTPEVNKGTYVVSKLPLRTWKGTHSSGLDLAGEKFGSFTVIGLSLDYPKRWVIKCVCGNYELATAKCIRSKGGSRLECRECTHVKKVYREKTGRDWYASKHLHDNEEETT